MVKEHSAKIVNTKAGNTLANLHPLSSVLFGSGYYLVSKKMRIVGKETGVVHKRSGVVKKIKDKIVTPNASPISDHSVSSFGKKSVLTQPSEITGDILSIVLIIIALYMVRKCNKINQVGFMQILAAFCCAPAYIVYRLIKPC